MSLFVATHLLAGHIFPMSGRWKRISGDVHRRIRGTTVGSWGNQVQIQLVDGDRVWQLP
jgi:hypothetical protein